MSPTQLSLAPIHRFGQALRLAGLSWGLALVHSASASASAPAGYRQYRDANGVLHVTNVEVHKDAALVHGRALPPLVPVVPKSSGTSLAERARPYNAIIEQAAKQYQLPVDLVRAVVRTESNYNPRARSYKGAMGLMQLMPATATWLGVEDAYDPIQNVFGGAKFLRLLANRFKGDMILVIAGYHAGAGAVQKYGGVPPYPTTRAYVKAVMRRFYNYRARSNQTP